MEIIDKTTEEMINDIKLGHFTQDGLDAVLKQLKQKIAGFDEIPPEILKIRRLEDVLLWLCNAMYEQSIIKE